MAHKTYNLIALQICSILMPQSALSCYEAGSVGMSKWPLCSAHLRSSVPQASASRGFRQRRGQQWAGRLCGQWATAASFYVSHESPSPSNTILSSRLESVSYTRDAFPASSLKLSLLEKHHKTMSEFWAAVSTGCSHNWSLLQNMLLSFLTILWNVWIELCKKL